MDSAGLLEDFRVSRIIATWKKCGRREHSNPCWPEGLVANVSGSFGCPPFDPNAGRAGSPNRASPRALGLAGSPKRTPKHTDLANPPPHEITRSRACACDGPKDLSAICRALFNAVSWGTPTRRPRTGCSQKNFEATSCKDVKGYCCLIGLAKVSESVVKPAYSQLQELQASLCSWKLAQACATQTEIVECQCHEGRVGR